MKNSADDKAPVFRLEEAETDNVFSLYAELFDEFMYPLNESEVTYVLSDTDTVKFSDTEDKIKISKGSVILKALKGGTATIRAYLVNDDSKYKEITIQIKPTELKKINVAKIAENGINGRATETKINFEPFGTGLTEKDVSIEAVENGNRIAKSGIISKGGKIYVSITAKTDSHSDVIKFKVVYKGATEGRKGVFEETAKNIKLVGSEVKVSEKMVKVGQVKYDLSEYLVKIDTSKKTRKCL